MIMAAQKRVDNPEIDGVLLDADSRMGKAVEALKRELNSLRTGQASPALLENLAVDYYGVPTPLNQIAAVTAPEAGLILVQPWDKQSLRDIEKSVLKSDMGLNPSNDGNVIRVPLPPLSQERRKDLVRLLKKKVEDGKISARNVRRDAMERLRSMERNKVMSQDDNRRAQDLLQMTTDSHIAQMDQVSTLKEADIMQV
jgi:ribosome recycling factor